MQAPASVRAYRRARAVVDRLVSRFSTLVGGASDAGDDDWELTRTQRNETRWRRGDERVDCFRFDDGYVTTVFDDYRDVTWQATPGPVNLGSSLAAAALYLQYRVTPQIDRRGRMFIAVDDGVPVQVFEEIADSLVDYVYLDDVRTVDEFPRFLDESPDLERAFERMSPPERQPL